MHLNTNNKLIGYESIFNNQQEQESYIGKLKNMVSNYKNTLGFKTITFEQFDN